MRAQEEVVGGFLEEARGYLPEIDGCLTVLEMCPGDPGTAGELERLVHNLRGAANVVGLEDVASIAEGMEQLLEAITRGGEGACDPSVAACLRQGLTELCAVLDTAGSTDEPAPQASLSCASELVDGFLLEAEELLETIGAGLDQIALNGAAGEEVRELRRATHTLKGAAAMVGLEAISSLAHRAEDVLDAVTEDRLRWDGALERVLRATRDLLGAITLRRGEADGLESEVAAVWRELDGLLETAAPEAAPEGIAPASGPVAQVESGRTLRVSIDDLNRLVKSVEEMYVEHSAIEQQLFQASEETRELGLTLARLRRLCSDLEAGQALAGITTAAAQPGGEFDALEFDRYTAFDLIVRDFAEAAADVGAAVARWESVNTALHAATERERGLIRDARQGLLGLRLVAAATAASRWERTVQATAARCGKPVEAAFSGLDTQIDKATLDRLAAPLEHVLRNAVDHGIEDVNVRRQLGKPDTGCVHVRFRRLGSHVEFAISDDGRGLDYEAIRASAVARGRLAADELPSPDRLTELVFQQGFSTAAEITEVSGRGVGLDAVRAAVESIGGSIAVESAPGWGATFRIRVPATVSLERVLMVEWNGSRYALTAAAVELVERASSKPNDPQLAVLGAGPVRLIVNSAGDRCAFHVDRAGEAREVIARPFEGPLARIPLLSGGVVLGDGSVVFLLNAAELVRQASLGMAEPHAPARTTAELHVLVVDDSLSVRRVVCATLEAQGWKAHPARDGVEALELLARLDTPPDAILMDVEMPRMDGFELASRLRGDERYRQTPIIMITSRAGPKHRGKALAIGVSEYLVKPYREEVLLASIRRWVAESRRHA